MSFKKLYLVRFLFCLCVLCSVAWCHAQTQVHIVLRGETIYQLSRTYSTTPKQIAKVNGLDSINQKLHTYQKLIIPNVYYEVNRQKDKRIRAIKHTISKGESLYSIAEKYNTTVYDILLRNPNIKRGEQLPINESLTIYANPIGKIQVSEQIVFLNGDKIDLDTVRIEDTLEFSIVQRFNNQLSLRVQNYLEETNFPKINVDTIVFPEDDKTNLTKLLYAYLISSQDSFKDRKPIIDSLQDEILYLPNRLKRQGENPNRSFRQNLIRLINLSSDLQALNDEHMAVRALIAYWQKDRIKTNVFTEEALALNPNNETAKFMEAALYNENRQYDIAIELHKNLFESYATRQFLIYNLATAYYYNFKFGEAIQFYGYLQDSDKIPEVNYRIAHCYYLLDNTEGACEYLHLASKQGHKKAQRLRSRVCKSIK